MHLSPTAYAWYYLWIAPHLLLPVIAWLIVRRGLLARFPWFFSYLVYESVMFLVTFTLSQFTSISDIHYRLIDACVLVGSISLRFCVVYEVFRNVSEQYPGLSQIGRTVAGWALAALLIVSIFVVLDQPGGRLDVLAAVGRTLNRSMSLIQCGLLVFLLAFSSYLKLSWHNFCLGVAIGLGVFASVDLASVVVLSELPVITRRVQIILDFVSMGTYHACVFVWLGYLLSPHREQRPPTTLPPNELESWDRELQRLVQQ